MDFYAEEAEGVTLVNYQTFSDAVDSGSFLFVN